MRNSGEWCPEDGCRRCRVTLASATAAIVGSGGVNAGDELELEGCDAVGCMDGTIGVKDDMDSDVPSDVGYAIPAEAP